MKQLLTIACLLVTSTASAAPGLIEQARLAAVYDSILHARFDEARTRLATTCPPAPLEACQVLGLASLWWQIQIDPDSRALDGELSSRSSAAIRATEQWTTREPQRAEAWFYLAGAYGPLTQWRILRGQRLAAARDALKIKNALERAIALDPAMHDAYFGIGLYHYYADIAPTALKFLRFLLLMPGGDRAQGLREMAQARAQGVLLAGEADYQMHYIYLWYEHDTARALDLLRSLDARYPDNPLFLERIAEVEDRYRHDSPGARQAWQTLLTRADEGRVEHPRATGTRARLGLAGTLVAAGDHARAIVVIAPVIAAPGTAPYGAHAAAHLIAARAYDQLGDRAQAITSIDRAIALAPRDDPQAIRSQARALRSRLRTTPR